MKDWKDYQERTYNNNICKLLIYFLNNYKINNSIDLGCGIWNTIYNSLNKDGYFVGQLFGNRDGWKDEPLINTFTIDEVKNYLQKYKIIKLDEIEYVRETDNKKWHYYNIIAQKNS